MEKLTKSLIPLASFFGVFAILNLWFLRPCVLTEESYRKSIVFVATIQQLPLALQIVLAVALPMLAVFRWKECTVGWAEVDDDGRIRVIVVVAAGILGWVYSTFEFNFFLEQYHGMDRLSLVALAILIAWRPIFVVPFLFVLWPFASQFDLPLHNHSWAMASLPAKILVLSVVLLGFGIVRRRSYREEFWFVLLCLVAGHYFTPGLGKLVDGWLLYDRIYYMLPNCYANGWLGFLSEETVSSLTRWLSLANLPMKFFAVVVELGAFAFLLHRNATKLFFVGWICFHVGIFAVSGIFFWSWIVLDATLLYLMRRTPLLSETHRSRVHRLVSVGLIGTSVVWTGAANLSWIDSPATYTYRFIAVADDGTEFQLPPRSLSPFYYQFTLSEFRYLTDEPTLNITWGATSIETFQLLRSATTKEELLDIERKLGGRGADPQRTERLAAFFRSYFQARRPARSPFSWLRAPRFLWGFHQEPDWRDANKAINRVRVERDYTAFFNGTMQTVATIEVISMSLESP